MSDGLYCANIYPVNLIKSIIFISCFIVISSLIAVHPHTAQAQDKIQVDHISVGFEKLKEKITLFFSLTVNKKIRYQIVLVNKRLAELKYAIDSEQIDLIEPTSSRYATYVGKLVNYVTKNKATASLVDINIMFENHKGALAIMRDKFPSNSAWWLMLQQDIDTINIFQNKLSLLNTSGT